MVAIGHDSGCDTDAMKPRTWLVNNKAPNKRHQYMSGWQRLVALIATCRPATSSQQTRRPKHCDNCRVALNGDSPAHDQLPVANSRLPTAGCHLMTAIILRNCSLTVARSSKSNTEEQAHLHYLQHMCDRHMHAAPRRRRRGERNPFRRNRNSAFERNKPISVPKTWWKSVPPTDQAISKFWHYSKWKTVYKHFRETTEAVRGLSNDFDNLMNRFQNTKVTSKIGNLTFLEKFH